MALRLTQISRTLAFVFLTLLATSALGGTARAAQPGVVSDLTWYISEADKQRTGSAMADLGSGWTRLAIQWREAEPERDKYNEWWLNEYQKAIDVAHSAGQHVIVMVDSAPAWASGSTSSNAPRDPQDFASFMSTVAARYAGQVDGWEIWNEENTSRFWSSGPDPRAYAALLRAAYPAVKAADPRAKVVFGGTAGNDYTFLEGVYAAGGKGFFDVLGAHPYPYCGSTGPEDVRMSGNRISKDSFLGYREMHATMLANGDGKPIWITEMGWTTSSAACNPGSGLWQGGVSETTQAEYLYRAYKLLEADPYVEVALWYNIRNDYWMSDSDTAEARFGLMNTDFSPKPAYGAFKAYAHGLPYATSPPPSTGGKPSPTGRKKKTRTSLRLAGSTQQSLSAMATGRVSQAHSGTVVVIVQVYSRQKWHGVRHRAEVRHSGRYSAPIRHLPQAPVRIRAVFHGTQDRRPSHSRYVRVKPGRDVAPRQRS